MKVDYSDIHRENEVLEGSLQEHLEHISWNERKTLAEKGVELDGIRCELLEITELQTAVNSRQRGDLSNVVSDIRNIRYNRDTSLARFTKTTRARMRLEAEREKFSSKSLFNVSRWKKTSGFDFGASSKFGTLPEEQDKVDAERRVQCDSEDTGNVKDNGKMLTSQCTTSSITNTRIMQRGLSSLSAHDGNKRQRHVNAVLSARPATVPRSRSRRELEKLCRLVPEHEHTIHLKVDWDFVSRTTRRHKLQQLKAENRDLQGKIRNFVDELDRLSKKFQVTAMTS
ncbi:hypothetical protein BsWGS_12235 [Bradybaena similaris]